jgi:hypothetical protein
MTDHQHKHDFDRISQQNSFTDLARDVEERPRGGGLLQNLVTDPVRAVVESTSYGKALRGRTNFEDYDLNQMIDLVEQTDPEDLESSGKALWDARDAIKAAATELSGHIEKVHWVGESGDAFREWGRSLVTSTHALSDFAGGAGDQITAAAVGLASVRKAMPPRDHRADRKAPKDFPKAEQVGTNDEYTAAVQAEKHRQEAINQMNRLSSYYSVSAEQLKSLQASAPEFRDMPDVGVPRPAPAAGQPSGHSPAGHVSTAAGAPGVAGHHASVAAGDHVVRHGAVGAAAPAPHIPDSTTHLDVPAAADTGTNIDSVGTVPPPSTTSLTGDTSPVAGVADAGGGRSSTFGPTFGTPLPSGMQGQGMGRVGSVRPPLSAQGRAAVSGGSGSASARSVGRGPMNPIGGAASGGQQTGKGLAPGGQSSAVGRGVAGGTPRFGGTATPRSGAGPVSGAGRSGGVVGGRPTAVEGAAKSGARIPRGTVVGGEGSAAPRTAAGRPGQRGVFGSPESAPGRPATGVVGSRGGAAASEAEAVTGSPTARTSAARAERNGMTRGGAGLVRGLGRQKKPAGPRDTAEATRSDNPVEEEETHPQTNTRRDVPPAVN